MGPVGASQQGPLAVVLVSGGLDSTVLLWQALDLYPLVKAVRVDWGQSTQPEKVAARRITDLSGALAETVSISTPGALLKPADFARGHNFLLVGAAAAHIGRESGDVLIGSLPSDHHADATLRFMNDATAAIAGPPGTGRVRVLAPLLDFPDKTSVLIHGLHLGAPLMYSRSCNRAQEAATCRTCLSCRQRATSIQEALRRVRIEEGITAAEVVKWQQVLGSWRHPEPREPDRTLASEIRSLFRFGDLLPWQVGWTYRGPDRLRRFTRSTEPHLSARIRARWRPCRYLRVAAAPYSEMEGKESWAMTVLADGLVVESYGDRGNALRAWAELVAARKERRAERSQTTHCARMKGPGAETRRGGANSRRVDAGD